MDISGISQKNCNAREKNDDEESLKKTIVKEMGKK